MAVNTDRGAYACPGDGQRPAGGPHWFLDQDVMPDEQVIDDDRACRWCGLTFGQLRERVAERAARIRAWAEDA